jgi:DNA-binding NtrC family response regulator
MHAHIVAIAASVIACSTSMLEAVRLAKLYCKRQDPIVITGPTGSGKSHLARLIHEWSERPGQLVEISAPELQDSLGYNQLFGHERWAFTDARTRDPGLVADASGGTILLDEGDLLERRFEMMLLRVLDTRHFRPLGTTRNVFADARLIIGSKLGLDELVRAGTWMPDLRHRIGFFEITVPALRERREDIAPLATRFLDQVAAEEGAASLQLSPDALVALLMAPWEGNVRELSAAIRLADVNTRVRGGNTVRVQDLPPHLRLPPVSDRRLSRDQKAALIAAALEHCGWNIGKTAAMLGLHRNTVSAQRRRLVARQRAATAHSSDEAAVHRGVVSSAEG